MPATLPIYMQYCQACDREENFAVTTYNKKRLCLDCATETADSLALAEFEDGHILTPADQRLMRTVASWEDSSCEG